MEINDLRITKLRLYLMSVINEIDNQYKQLNISFLSSEPNNYSLDKIPTNKVVEPWIIGINLNQDVYSFRSRMNYSEDTIQNIKNIGFFEIFEKKIYDRNMNRNLPEIAGIESISCLNCGTMNNATTNSAEFDIQIQITYKEVQ